MQRRNSWASTCVRRPDHSPSAREYLRNDWRRGLFGVRALCRTTNGQRMDLSKYDDPAKGTRRAITTALVVGGAVAGALIGVGLTPLGKIVAGAPPADAANYIWNALVFGVMGALA